MIRRHTGNYVSAFSNGEKVEKFCGKSGRFLWLTAILIALVFVQLASANQAEATLRVASFSCDATPPIGEPMIWATRLDKVVTPLLVKGVVLEAGINRFVLCAFDWCLIANDSEKSFREVIARAAGTKPENVSVHSIHQHAAPYADAGAHKLLDAAQFPLAHLSDKFLAHLEGELANSVSEATRHLEVFDEIGTGEARVDRVASARRIHDAKGKLLIRFSTGGKDKIMADAPEGDIDPMVKTITFAQAGKPLVRLHFYATHPQTFCCDGRASADFVGEARENLEKAEHIPQIYFTGCAGDITVGKYNDGSPEAYEGLKARLGEGFKAAIAATHYEPVKTIVCRNDSLNFSLRDSETNVVAESKGWLNDAKQSDTLRVYKGAMRMAYVQRQKRPVGVSSLKIGNIRIVNLPGEPMISFQRYAQSLCPGQFVAVAGYADCGTAYICTEDALTEGGYEPASSNLGKGAEEILRNGIQNVLIESKNQPIKN